MAIELKMGAGELLQFIQCIQQLPPDPDLQFKLDLDLTYFLQLAWQAQKLPDEDQDALKLKSLLSKKLDKLSEREYYTQYKIAPTLEQREKARQEYLDKKGIPTDFRW